MTRQGTGYKVGKTAECIVHTGKYSGAITSVTLGVNATTKAGQLTVSAANFSAKAAQITDNINNASGLTKFWNQLLWKRYFHLRLQIDMAKKRI